jgi:hypothetical protein
MQMPHNPRATAAVAIAAAAALGAVRCVYSVVKLEFEYETSTFLIVSKDVKERFILEGIEHLKSDTPIAHACLGKGVGDEISYIVRGEFDRKARILECSLPSLQQIEELISRLDVSPRNEIQNQTDAFYLQSQYGTNASRYRKGG